MSTFARSQGCSHMADVRMQMSASSSGDPPQSPGVAHAASGSDTTLKIVADVSFDNVRRIWGYAFAVDQQVRYCGRAQNYMTGNGEMHQSSFEFQSDATVTCLLKICDMLDHYKRRQHVVLYVRQGMKTAAMYFDQKHCKHEKYFNHRFPVFNPYIEYFTRMNAHSVF